MHELKNDELDKIMEKEEPEGMEFYLMAGMKPGARLFVVRCLSRLCIRELYS